MNSVDALVKKTILTFPEMYENRTDVLAHILCLIDLGYMWDENGEIEFEDGEIMPLWTPENERLEFYLAHNVKDPATMTGATAELYAEMERVTIPLCMERVAAVDTLVETVGAVKEPYTQWGESLLMNIPNNVSEDWLKACDEMMETMSEHNWVF